MNKDLLVRFFVPTLPGPDTARAGTGYPVARDLVLTAAHVVYPERFPDLKVERDASRHVEVLWQGDPAAHWEPLPKLDSSDSPVVWEDVGFDAVLVSCPRPDSLNGYGHMSSAPPFSDEKRESAGYAEAARKGNVRALLHCKGTTHSMASSESEFKVNPEERTGTKGWGGASGMPITRANANTILGIVIETGLSEESKVEQLKVLPAFCLMKQPKFRSLLRSTLEEDLRTECRRRLNKLLARSDTARIRLCEHIRSCTTVTGASTEQIVDALMDAVSVQEIIEGINDAIRGAWSGERDFDKDDKVLVDVMCRLLPWYWRPDDLASLRHKILADEIVVVAVPTGVEMLAETHVAAGEARSVDLSNRQHEQDFTAGGRRLGAPPTTGIRRPGMQPGQAYARAMESLLEGKFVVESPDSLRRAVQEFLFSAVRPTGVPDYSSDERQVAFIKRQLDLDRREKGRPYLLWRGSSGSQETESLERQLEALAVKYHWLMILRLRSHENDELEIIPYDLVTRIILRAQNAAPKDSP